MPAISLKEFFDKNHIQGYRNAITAFVLKDRNSNEVLMAYLIGKAFFGNGKYDAEIIRGACKLNHVVIGGASKLWRAITDYYNTHNLNNDNGQVNSIVYYVDRNLYNGSSMRFLPNVTRLRRQHGFWNFFLDTKELKNRNPKKHKEICQMIEEGKVLIIGNAGTEVNVWHRE